MPTDTDLKLSDDLAKFRFEAEGRFVSVEKSLASIHEQLKIVRWIGVTFAGILVTLVGTSITVAWNASAVVSDVRYLQRDLSEMRKDIADLRAESKARDERLNRTLDRIADRLAAEPAPKK